MNSSLARWKQLFSRAGTCSLSVCCTGTSATVEQPLYTLLYFKKIFVVTCFFFCAIPDATQVHKILSKKMCWVYRRATASVALLQVKYNKVGNIISNLARQSTSLTRRKYIVKITSYSWYSPVFCHGISFNCFEHFGHMVCWSGRKRKLSLKLFKTFTDAQYK